MAHLTTRRRWAFFGIALAIGAGAMGVRWRYAAANAAPVEDPALLAVAVTESTTLAESRGAGSDLVVEESPLAGPRGLGTMTGRAPGTTEIIAGVRLASHKVNVVIQDGLARTEVEETFENTTARVLEGRYLFPVPPDASVSRLALYVGAELVEGEIVERERAARIFKGIVEDTVRPRDPALLEWVKGSEVSLKVFPIPAHGTRKIVLAYDQVLSESARQMRYLYPLSLGQDRAVSIDEFSLDVTAADAATSLVAVRTPGYAATTAPSGPLHLSYSARAFTPASDFVLEYERAPSAGPDVSAYPARLDTSAPIGKTPPREDGYLAMRLPIRRPTGTQARERHDRAIVLDVSQSQSQETLAGEIAVARGILRRLDPEERFTLLACDSACAVYPEDGLATPSSTTLDDAGRWLQARSIGGSSDIAGALLDAAKRVTSERAGQIVYLGDGAASAGELTAETIAARVRPEIQGHKLDLRLLGAGRTLDEVVLGGLARSLGASYERVSTGEPLARRIDAITLGLEAPLLVDPALEVPEGIYDVHPKVLPNLHAGQELLITARVREGERGEIKIKGTLGGVAYTDSKAIVWETATPPVPPRLWASAKIADLEASNDEASRKEVIALSKAHRVMSRAASFLVLENDQMFSEFGIERAAKKAPREELGTAPKSPDSSSFGGVGLLDNRPSPLEPTSGAGPTGTDAPASGGLGLTGMGEGGGGRGEGGGLGSIGTIGHSAGTWTGQGFGGGSGRLGGAHRSSVPQVRMGGVTVNGSLPPEVIQRIVRQNFGRFRLCYENGLRNNPELRGRVTVRFVISAEGNVSGVSNGGSDLPDAGVVACVVSGFNGLMFPFVPGGSVTVSYPILFAPADESRVVSDTVTVHREPEGPSAVHREGNDQWMTEGEAALGKLRGAMREGETSRQRHDALIHGLLARGRFAEALTAARRFAELDPDLASAHELLAQAAAAAGEGSLARTSLDAELETTPASRDLHARAARAFEAAGDERRACAHFRSLAELRKSEDDARYEAFRCRARLGERDAVLAELSAFDKPGKRVTELARVLATGSAPAYDGAASGGELEAKLSCADEAERCPTLIVVTPSGNVISPWTPAARGGAVTTNNLSSGTYRTMLIGGEPDAACEVTVRALGTTRKLARPRGGARTIAATSVTFPEVRFGFLQLR
jgi:Vault protein inter-alpha-trypsin domain/von Willebrand factor type A domain